MLASLELSLHSSSILLSASSDCSSSFYGALSEQIIPSCPHAMLISRSWGVYGHIVGPALPEDIQACGAKDLDSVVASTIPSEALYTYTFCSRLI